jgi:hypothetical protein
MKPLSCIIELINNTCPESTKQSIVKEGSFMKKFLSLSVCAACLLLFICEAQAGLINYQRRNKGGAPVRAGARAAVPAAPVGPAWIATPPAVKNSVEKAYDVNRDGKLQPAEVKIYLRGVIETIESKGGFTINSDILKEYDKNKDGLISRSELPDLKRDAGI